MPSKLAAAERLNRRPRLLADTFDLMELDLLRYLVTCGKDYLLYPKLLDLIGLTLNEIEAAISIHEATGVHTRQQNETIKTPPTGTAQ